MTEELTRPEGPFRDETDRKLQWAEHKRRVVDGVVESWRQAASFNKDAYARQLSAEVEHRVRQEMRGRLASEVDSEIEYCVGLENAAIKDLAENEAEICAGFGIRPSQYLLYKEPQ